MVDLQYRGLAWIFGNDAHALTIIKKVLVDQFICTAGYSTPFWVLFYGLRASRYDLLKTARQISPHWYLSRVSSAAHSNLVLLDSDGSADLQPAGTAAILPVLFCPGSLEFGAGLRGHA